MSRLIFSIGLLVLVACASGTKFTDCGSTSGTVTKVEVSDCPDSDDTCILQKGTSKAISISFQSKSASPTVKAVVHGVIAGVPIPFPLPKSDGCKTGLTCPLTSGTDYVYSNTLPIKNSYPTIGVTVRWELQDDQSNDIVCIELNCKVQ